MTEIDNIRAAAKASMEAHANGEILTNKEADARIAAKVEELYPSDKPMTRADRRRAARHKEWHGHNADQHQSLDPLGRLHRHTEECVRCSTGTVAWKGCAWVDNFARRNPELLTKLMGQDESDALADEKRLMDALTGEDLIGIADNLKDENDKVAEATEPENADV